MNNKLRQKAKNNFGKGFFQLMNNAVFGKTMENIEKHRNIKLATTERRRNYSLYKPNQHFVQCFKEHVLEIGMNKCTH